MYLIEELTMYRLAQQLTEKGNFEVIHIDGNNKEIWLEKYERKSSEVVRLVHEGFDWKNHLKRDIATVFQKAKGMKRFFGGKHVQIHNVYISSHSPVDDWEILKKPMQLDEKNPIKMKVYYLSEAEAANELNRLQRNTDSTIKFNIPSNQPEEEMEEEVRTIRSRLGDQYKRRRKEEEDVFKKGKPLLTYILLAVNIFMFYLLETNGGSESTDVLIQYGAKYNPAILEDGEWWRIVSSMFLHIGFLHLLMNMLAVYYLGTAVERIYGSFRFIIIYFLAGIGGGLASFAFNTSIAAGASGALFGLFGALLFFGLVHKRIFFQTMGTNLLIVIGINVVFGLSVPQIDNGAHFGGLIAGFIASAILHLPGKRKIAIQLTALLLYAAMLFGLIQYGTERNLESQMYYVMKAELLIKKEKHEEVIGTATKGLEYTGEFESQLLFHRSYAYIQEGQTKKAIDDLRNALEINSSFPEAHYNLAILYQNQGEMKKAKQHIEQAYDLRPDKEDIQKLYEQIKEKSMD
ncbi:rhomboid family intramembrane serine protease [Virgibacillus kekensis]|uniref:Rhomboid family intramembrane serine protease n=1 Tax=Virgibacillus kekensis TaxID=202261 RepID=A0ABV9DK83_9BACI